MIDEERTEYTESKVDATYPFKGPTGTVVSPPIPPMACKRVPQTTHGGSASIAGLGRAC